MEKRKNYMGFHIPKIWQILKCFTGSGAFSLEYIHIFKFLMSVLLLKKCCEKKSVFSSGSAHPSLLGNTSKQKNCCIKIWIMDFYDSHICGLAFIYLEMFVKGIKYDFE